MALLLYSAKCKHSMEVKKFIDSKPQILQIIRFHDVTSHGIPPQYRGQITRVPTMLTKNGKMLVGNEIRAWLDSLLPPEELTACQLGGWGGNLSSLDGSDEGGGDMFELSMYGQALQPAMTSELEDKINRSVSDAYQNTIKK